MAIDRSGQNWPEKESEVSEVEEKIQVFIEVQGGLVQNIECSLPSAVDVHIIDWDEFFEVEPSEARERWEALEPQAQEFIRSHYAEDYAKLQKLIR